MDITIQKPTNNLEFKVCNGTCYSTKTPNKIIEVLEYARQYRTRIKIDYGTDDGQSWGETSGVTGYIGRSTGIEKIPLMIFNKRSIGGGAILDHCIVRIITTKGKQVLYTHADYKPYIQPTITR